MTRRSERSALGPARQASVWYQVQMLAQLLLYIVSSLLFFFSGSSKRKKNVLTGLDLL